MIIASPRIWSAAIEMYAESKVPHFPPGMLLFELYAKGQPSPAPMQIIISIQCVLLIMTHRSMLQKGGYTKATKVHRSTRYTDGSEGANEEYANQEQADRDVY